MVEESKERSEEGREGVGARPEGSSQDARLPKRRKGKILRPPGLAVFAVFVVLLGIGWWLYADTLVERGVEQTGASLTGARVDVESADVRPLDGVVRLTGLQVANPDRPMKNLFEAEEISAELMLGPLLEKKVVIESLNVLGVRFDTDRETSGALENPDPEAGRLWRSVDAWADQIEIPEMNLETLGGVVRTEAIDADSLATVQHARRIVSRADSMRQSWQSELEALDPRPRIDSLESVVQRLEAFRPTPMNALQVPALLRDGRGALENLTSLQNEIQALDQNVRQGVSSLAIDQETIDALRARDMAYARSLLDIPSLDAPTISPALFGETALVWLKPVLYWAQRAERVLPPGLDPRRRPGPQRARAEGTTYSFRQGAEWPAFLLQQGDLGVILGGTGLAAGSYTGQLRNLTSAPALLGEPMVLTLGREEGVRGPGSVSLLAILDHTTEVIRDSVDLSLQGLGLPSIPIEAFGGRLDLGQGQAAFNVARSGELIAARMRWVTDDVSWMELGAGAADQPGGAGAAAQGGAADSVASSADTLRAPPAGDAGQRVAGALQQIRGEVGSPEWARDLIRGTIAGLERVELSMAIEGTLESPELSISSNLGAAVAQSLQREVGREVEAAEARMRAEVNAQIQPLVQNAQGRVEELRTGLVQRVDEQRAEVEELRARLEERIRELVGGESIGS